MPVPNKRDSVWCRCVVCAQQAHCAAILFLQRRLSITNNTVKLAKGNVPLFF